LAWRRFATRLSRPSPTCCLLISTPAVRSPPFSVSAATGAGIGTIIAFKLIGYFADAGQSLPGQAFDKIVVVAGLIPLLGVFLVLLLVRNTRATAAGLVRPV
jgi:hypothetical protein